MKRVLLSDLTVPDITAADFDNPLSVDLLTCVETMDEELVSDGTNIAQVPLYSRMTGIRLSLNVLGTSGTANVIRWFLYKKPDGESLITSLASPFHSSSDSPTQRELRKYTLAKGIVVTNPSSASAILRLRISRKAMARVSPWRENDKLTLLVAKDAAAVSAKLNGFGQIYVKANA